jgi:hypothetical protein
MMALLDEALHLAAFSFRVHPLDGKRPLAQDWPTRASAEPAAIRALFAAHPAATGVGIATGQGLLVLDVDVPKGGDESLGALIQERGQLPRTVIALTGGGGWHYYFKAPPGLRNTAGRLGKGLDTRGEGGQVAAPPSPHPSGTSYEWAEGYSPTDTTIADAPAWLVELCRPAAEGAPLPPPRERPPQSARRSSSAPAATSPRCRRRSRGDRGHDATFKAAIALVRGFCLSEADAYDLLAGDFNPRCEPAWSERELRHKIASATKNSTLPFGYLVDAQRPERPQLRSVPRPPEPPPHEDGDMPPELLGNSAAVPAAAPAAAPRPVARAAPVEQADESGRPLIHITTEENVVTNAAIQALGRDDSLFQRAGRLVHVVRDESRLAGFVRAPNAPRIVELPRAGLRERMVETAAWRKHLKAEARWVPSHPPDWAVAQVEARGSWVGIRPLENVVEAPVLRPDGTVISTPGFDDATGLLFSPTADYLPVPSSPSHADAVRAREELLEVVCDFPFASDAHRAGWLAGVLTPFARYSFAGPAPLFLADANTRGSGKSLLTDTIAAIAAGRPMARLVKPEREEEWTKKITSIALAGDAMVLMDNVTGMLGGASLDSALTGTEWSDRLLGGNEMVRLPLLAIWYATGNNVVLNGDTIRRTLQIRLESPHERPEERTTFRHPHLLDWIRLERPRLVRAALTLLRAYAVAGKPDMRLPSWGSFDGWSRLLRHAIVWTGYADPGATRVQLNEASDHETRAIRNLVDGLAELDPGEKGLTVREILDRLDMQPKYFEKLRAALDEIAPPQNGKYDSRKVGRNIQKYRRRIVGDRCVDRAGTDSDNVSRWTILALRGAGSGGSVGSAP